MSDEEWEDGIELSKQVSKENPAAVLVAHRDGMDMRIRNGYTGNPAEAHLWLMAGYMEWLASEIDWDINKVATEVAKRSLRHRENNAIFQSKDLFDEEGD
jgi:hypothetical protein